MAQFYTEKETVKAVKQLLSKKMTNIARMTTHEGLRVFPDSKQLRFLQAHIAAEARDFKVATRAFDELIAESPDSVELLQGGAKAWSDLGDFDKAIQYTERITTLTGNKQESIFVIVDIYERNNKAAEAEEMLKQVPQEIHGGVKYQILKSRIHIANKEYTQAIDLVNSFLGDSDSRLEDANKIGIHFLLSKAYDRIGEYDKAWNAARGAHELDNTVFQPDKFFSQFTEMRKFMTKEMLDVLVEGPETEVEPLFIVGNPRSGTSLLEQIMSMHPEIENGGEMSTGLIMQVDVPTLTDSFHAWPQSLIDLQKSDAAHLSQHYCSDTEYFRKGKKVVSNKALNLPVQLGFLSKILPSSRAIMLHRNPLDNAVSCYTTNLLAAGHIYTNSLESLAKTWVERKKMTDLWLEIVSIPVMELHYEELVANQRKETERIISFLDLQWQEECMEFHKSKYVARTISYDQVNKKMYTSSSGRWKNYEKHLGPVIDIVSEYI